MGPISAFALCDFLALLPKSSFKIVVVQEEGACAFVQDGDAARRDSAEREFRLSGCAELADDDNIEGYAQVLRNLECDRNSSAGQAYDSDIFAVAKSGEQARELLARFNAIPKAFHGKGLPTEIGRFFIKEHRLQSAPRSAARLPGGE
jgi:hypothetical protein